jgi:hypothetical protein
MEIDVISVDDQAKNLMVENVDVQLPSHAKPGFIRRLGRRLRRLLSVGFCIFSLVVLLALLTAIPILQLIAFGYLLEVSGRLKNGGQIRNALPQLRQAGSIGMAAAAIFLAALPAQLLTHWESVAQIIDANSSQAKLLRVAAIASSILAMIYLMWAWVRGATLRCYLWPQPKRFFREAWRWRTWRETPDQLWDFTNSLDLPKYFWLGLRGAAGTLIWLSPTIIIIFAFREGETGLAGIVGFVAILCLGFSLLYLPMLQAHFAAENRLSAIFERKRVRQLFRSAPWACLFAMIFSLFVTPIPLYLLKIEATPKEVVWLPCLVFIAFILPAKIGMGLAMRRAERRTPSVSRLGKIARFLARAGIFIVVAIYVVFVYVSQYTSWDGLLTWIQQHAILIPVPFLSGT